MTVGIACSKQFGAKSVNSPEGKEVARSKRATKGSLSGAPALGRFLARTQGDPVSEPLAADLNFLAIWQMRRGGGSGLRHIVESGTCPHIAPRVHSGLNLPVAFRIIRPTVSPGDPC